MGIKFEKGFDTYHITTFILIIFFSFPLLSGTFGTISGKVYDTKSDEILVGANILIQNTEIGNTSDRSGRFLLTHLPAGKYNIEVNYIGYKKYVLKDVIVQSDHRTDISVPLEREIIKGETVYVVAKHKLIQKDITGSTHFISSEKIKALPIQSIVEAVELQPGVAAGHIRGGRKNEVVYLIDGIPVMDAISGEISSILAKDAVNEMSVQTGGFNAEYGNAMSGIVNLTMKSGQPEHEISIRTTAITHKDKNLFNPKTNESYGLEISDGGKIFKSPHRYFLSFNYFHNEFIRMKESYGERKAVRLDPKSLNWHSAVKLSSDPSRPIKLTFQSLLSYWDWREHEQKWTLNKDKLPWQGKRSIRNHLELLHTINPKLYYSVKIGQLHLMRQVFGKDVSDLKPIEFQTIDYYGQEIEDPFSFILGGDYPWWMDHEEKQNFLKFECTYQINHFHQIKSGLEFNQYYLYKRSVMRHQITFGDAAYLRYFIHNVNYEYSPRRKAFYIQDKIDYDGLVANIGIRFDIFDPRASRPALEEKQMSDSTIYSSTWVINYQKKKKASIKYQISPRIGIALPVSDDSEFRINYGHFFQLPLFDYLYTNADYTIVQGFTPLGDPDLKPAKTIAIEVGYKKSFLDKYLIDLTIFQKEMVNLVDVNTYLHEGSYFEEMTGISGLTRYVNIAYSFSKGAEVLFKFSPTKKTNGYISYTFMYARGTASSEFHQFELLIQEYEMPPKTMEYDLSWDQRHTFIGHLEHTFSKNLRTSLLYRWNSPLPYTRDNGLVTYPNNKRMSPTSTFDLRIDKIFRINKSEFIIYVEGLNLFNTKNILWKDRHGIPGGYLGDPSAYDQQRRAVLGFYYEIQ